MAKCKTLWALRYEDGDLHKMLGIDNDARSCVMCFETKQLALEYRDYSPEVIQRKQLRVVRFDREGGFK